MTQPRPSQPPAHRAFTLVELLVSIAVIALLIGILIPSLASARNTARGVKCSSNLRQLLIAWSLYAADFKDRAMPLASWDADDIGTGEQVFWWGTHGTPTTPPDFTRGFLYPYLGSALTSNSVLECPSQPWGTYRPQGPSRTITSTFGYNGYYLSPSQTPGWASSIQHRPWQRLSTLPNTTTLLVFADTLLPSFGSGQPGNTALLDPPLLFSGDSWSPNAAPTTAFRHGPGEGAAHAAHPDAHASTTPAAPGWLTHPAQHVGSIQGEAGMGAFYVPDFESWHTQ